MRYAFVENGVVVNFIWLYPGNADDFPNAVFVGNVPVRMGDSCVEGVFYRDGERLLSEAESARAEAEEANAVIENLIGGVNDVQYE